MRSMRSTNPVSERTWPLTPRRSRNSTMPRPEKTDRSPHPQRFTPNEVLTIRVWDPFVRLFHWGLVLSFGVAWFSSKSWEQLHDWAGYAAAALVLSRAA